MFITSVAYDYYKGFVTAFIEITDNTDAKLFGKPPVHRIVPMINIIALIESILSVIFWILVAIRSSVPSMSMFIVFVPVEIFFIFMLGLMLTIFSIYVVISFKHTRKVFWIVAYCLIFPVVFINLVLFFGMPILVSILFPLQNIKVLQGQRSWDVTLFLVLWLVGGLLKAFVRPSEDDSNPYQHDNKNVTFTAIYVCVLFLIAVFIFLISARLDQKVPFSELPFPPVSYWIVFIPIFVIWAIGTILYSIKAFLELKLVYKKGDVNGDGIFKSIYYIGMIIFLIMALITSILLCVKLSLPTEDQDKFSLGWCFLPFILGFFTIACCCSIPFFPQFRKVKSAALKNNVSGEVEEAAEKEMQCFL
ncbi:hypothetical protein C9374_000198 [Naegleria lovaniensis]|uniref:Uncharacterized protein n=1 Tax=Naegleria lovaniensis TaxID=51637 RepID=A0AA88GZZ3_NAELO|nr:uncharacterized protein C9374_000198 [Naegleria lovaniensis]KAG2388759.1 hypothetical protein C9374_000198 [Naegleria lovaniensis]